MCITIKATKLIKKNIFIKTPYMTYFSVASHRSFLYVPPKDKESSDPPLEGVAPKEVIPLLRAVKSNGMTRVWKIYRNLVEGNKLHLLTPIQHSFVLKAFDLKGKHINFNNAKLIKSTLLYIFGQMKLIGHQPNIIDYTHLLNVFSRIQETRLCKNLWNELTIQQGMKPTIYMYNSYLASCLYRKKLNLEKVNLIIRELIKSGLNPNLTTYSLLIRIQCCIRNYEAAQEILDQVIQQFPRQFPKNSSSPSHPFSKNFKNSSQLNWELRLHKWAMVRALRSMIGLYGYSGKFLEMDNCFKILTNYINPDIKLFNSIISHTCNHLNFEKAQQYLDQMFTVYHIKPDFLILHSLVKCLCHQGKTQLSCKLLDEMKEKFDINPSDYSLALIYKVMIKKKRIADAQEFVKKWKIPENWIKKNFKNNNNSKLLSLQ